MTNSVTSETDQLSDTSTVVNKGSDIVTIPEAAVRLGKCERTIRRLIKSGELHTIKSYGKTLVQLASHVPGETITVPEVGQVSNTVPNVQNVKQLDVQTVSDVQSNDGQTDSPLVEALRETINEQKKDIVWLRGEITAVRQTLESVTKMLPAPDSYNQQQQGGGQVSMATSNDIWAYIVAGILIVAAALVIYATR